MKAKYISVVIGLIVLVFSVVIVGEEYYEIRHSKRPVLSNLRGISTVSCYVYVRIKAGNKSGTIVCPNVFLYSNMTKGSKYYPLMLYIYKVGSVIKNNNELEVSDNLYNDLKDCIVNPSKVSRYKGEILFGDTSIVKDNYINPKLGWEEQKAVIYSLLLKDISCCMVSGGMIEIVNNK